MTATKTKQETPAPAYTPLPATDRRKKLIRLLLRALKEHEARKNANSAQKPQ